MALTLAQLNAASPAQFVALLEGVYEHSPWIAERAAAQRPFRTLAQLKAALATAVRKATRTEQLGLIRAHPELAGKAAVAGTLTAESTQEQNRAGLTHCSPAEFERLQSLNATYSERFGLPFILAVRGPRGKGLTRTQIIETFARRVLGGHEFELAESLRNIDRIAELRLNDKFDQQPALGEQVWDWAEALARHTEESDPNRLSVTYLTEAHRACAADLQGWMREAGFDEVHQDAVGNVVGVYHGTDPGARRLLTGSHFDTVRDGGRFDGRLGILVPLAAVRELHRTGKRLPFGIEVVGFAEEEGLRFPATFLASSALVGQFDPAWLDQTDAQGISMRTAMQAAGLPGTMAAIEALKRDAARYLGFVEVHIEQGPVLAELNMPLGVVTSINGSVRLLGEVVGVASHAGTTPMNRRHDAAAAVAELVLYVEERASSVKSVVGTVGMLEVPGGSINVVPGCCRFSIDIRATNDGARNTCLADVWRQIDEICSDRGVEYTLNEVMRVPAAPSDSDWQHRWETAVAALGLPVHHLPSGAGHDAMKMDELLPQAMLFVRGENAGISHNPLESSTCDDIQLAVEAFQHLLEQLATEKPSR
ncbi:MAG: 2-oxo-4-hydroxy-4-carboxy-5-ureidoimidazoline decarboxylase [Leptothrix sp. (in: b-proteobacteria)]